MRGFRHWRWHLDEMYVKLGGEMVYLWRAIDQEGEVLESYVTSKRDKPAALLFMKKALKRHGSPEAITTDGLRSYPSAMAELGNLDRRATGHWLNNRAENSHLPFRRRERAMLRFRQMKGLQKFASVHASVRSYFNLERPSSTERHARPAARSLWSSGSCSSPEACSTKRQLCQLEKVAIRPTAPLAPIGDASARLPSAQCGLVRLMELSDSPARYAARIGDCRVPVRLIFQHVFQARGLKMHSNH